MGTVRKDLVYATGVREGDKAKAPRTNRGRKGLEWTVKYRYPSIVQS